MLEKIEYKKFVLPVIVGVALWALTPLRPTGVTAAAWLMLAIFVATILGCITKPLPIGAVAIIGFTITVVTGGCQDR